MSASASEPGKRHPRVYVPTTALAQEVESTEEMMQVLLTDGRIISVPLIWFPALRAATPEQRANYRSARAAAACTGPTWTKICPSPG
jgi:hypothetical protein